ncbi:MAG: NUDIX hydrolase [Alphaproteobacteria bacterium]|nr:NUDIX hydrolase [Alphaproteobacteria bacterium]
MNRPAFDPDDDPTQLAAAAMQRDLLGEADVVRMDGKAAGVAPRPRDAATLILYRLDDNQPRILMGCRSKGHDFMPDKYVFPGGRVDTEDGAVPSLSELPAAEDLALRTRSRRRPRAFPLTAIREMFEETGLIVGREAGRMSNIPPSWADYYAQNVAPCLAGFTFVGRAITPPMRHKRFDARFFMADASDCLIDDRPPVDGRELADLRWFTLAQVAELDLPNVTRYVISEVEARLVRRETLRPFMLRWSAKGHVRERL